MEETTSISSEIDQIRTWEMFMWGQIRHLGCQHGLDSLGWGCE